MDSRLLTFTVLLPVVAVGAAYLPGLGLAASVLAAVVALGWAWTRGGKASLLALIPGALILWFLLPGGLPSYAAGGVGGTILASAVRRGLSPGWATLMGALPFAAWTLWLSVSGFDPIPPELVAEWERIFAATQGPGRVQESADVAVAIVRRTWVASEILWFAAILGVAYRISRRGSLGQEMPLPTPIRRFDVPDGLVVGLIAGLGLVLLGGDGVAQIVGWNSILGTGVLYTVRGIGITVHWMDRAKVGRGMRIAFFIANVVLFLPVFAAVTAALGLFDTWFDFRRLRGTGGGRHPLSMFDNSSGDDLKE